MNKIQEQIAAEVRGFIQFPSERGCQNLAERIEVALRATALATTHGILSRLPEYLLKYGEIDASFAGSRAAVDTYSDAMHAGLSALRGETE